MPKSITVSIWHGYRQDGATVTEIETNMSLTNFAFSLQENGGFLREDDDGRSFVPWHQVRYLTENK